MPVGRVVGRIEAGDPQAVRGLAVRVRTDPDPAADVAGVGGFASVVTDDQGRFTIPAIAAGTLALSVEHRWDLPWRGRPAGRPQVRPGTTTEVTIPLKRAGLVKGIVQEDPERPAGRRRGRGRCPWTSMIPWRAAMPRDGSPPTSRPGRVFAVSRRHAPRLLQPLDHRGDTPAAARGDGGAHAGADRAAPGRRAARARPRRGGKARAGGGCLRSPGTGRRDPTAGASARSPTARGDSGSPACRPTRRSTSRRPAARRRPRRPCRSRPARGRST